MAAWMAITRQAITNTLSSRPKNLSYSSSNSRPNRNILPKPKTSFGASRPGSAPKKRVAARKFNRLKYGYQGANGQWISERIDAPQQQKKLAINMNTQVRSGDLVLRLEKLVVGYAAQPEHQEPSAGRNAQYSVLGSTIQLIQCPNLEMHRGQRVALMGPNGSGKTTLLRTIVGDLPPLRGQVRLGHKVTINYYAQAHEGLQMSATVLDEFAASSH